MKYLSPKAAASGYDMVEFNWSRDSEGLNRNRAASKRRLKRQACRAERHHVRSEVREDLMTPLGPDSFATPWVAYPTFNSDSGQLVVRAMHRTEAWARFHS